MVQCDKLVQELLVNMRYKARIEDREGTVEQPDSQVEPEEVYVEQQKMLDNVYSDTDGWFMNMDYIL